MGKGGLGMGSRETPRGRVEYGRDSDSKVGKVSYVITGSGKGKRREKGRGKGKGATAVIKASPPFKPRLTR